MLQRFYHQQNQLREKELERQQQRQLFLNGGGKQQQPQQQQQTSPEMGFTNPFHVRQQMMLFGESSSLGLIAVPGNASTTSSTSSSQSSTQSSQCSQIDNVGKFPMETTNTRGQKMEKMKAMGMEQPIISLSKRVTSGVGRNQINTGFGLSTKPGQLQYQPLPQQRKYDGQDTETNNESMAGEATIITTSTITTTAATTTTSGTSSHNNNNNNNTLVSRLGKFYSSRQHTSNIVGVENDANGRNDNNNRK